MSFVLNEGVKKHYALYVVYSHLLFLVGNRKAAARTLSFLSEAVSGARRPGMRPGTLTEKEPLNAQAVLGKINFVIFGPGFQILDISSRFWGGFFA